MKIRCNHCGVFFCPSDESLDLISEGYISSDIVNFCDDCWDKLEHVQDDISELPSDADMGL
jgi:hypothetical protein